MIKRLILILTVLLITFTAFALPIYSDDSKDSLKIGDKKPLPSGDAKVYMGKTLNGKQVWKATIGEPEYLPGTDIPYDTMWHIDKDGYYAGNNIFDAIVKNNKVEVTYDNKKSQWQPDLYIGSTKLKSKDAELLTVDPINENYLYNTIKWEYDYGISRYLRIIEGVLIEYYIVDSPLGDDLLINNGLTKDKDYVWQRPIVAYDADYEAVLIEETTSHNIILSKNVKATYPITIDPDSSFTTSSSDAFALYTSLSYATARTSVVPTTYSTSSVYLDIGQNIQASYYDVRRSWVYYDTSSIPDDSTVTSSTLNIYGLQDLSVTDFNVAIQTGMPTYPHDPFDYTQDYYYDNYSGNGGLLYTSLYNTGQYNNITVSATGLTWINKTGTTKFALRSDQDANNSTPTTAEYVRIYSYEQGAGYRPTLDVTYTANVPDIEADEASNVALNSARLNATVNDDGGESCQVRWGYGTSNQTVITSYDTVTAWSDAEWDTGEHPYYDSANLTQATTYYYRAQIMNSTYNGTSNEIDFTTESSFAEPDNFRGYPSATSISLSWNKGNGTENTLIIYSTTGYPATTTNGTFVYEDNESVYSHTGLTAGTTYYYSAWGESSDNYTAEYATLAVTTLALETGGDDLETPGAFTNWFQEPDYTNLSNLEPIYSAVNAVADGMDMPRNSFWQGLLLIIISVICIAVMLSAGLMAGLVVGIVLLVLGAGMGILPTWMIFMIIVYGLLGWTLKSREAV